MRLLIVTQVIDKNHPILGFFHGWVEELASRCEQVQVICLQAGVYNLPQNVTVYSLGKDEGKGRMTYLFRFFSYVWCLRKEYDTVFVHMNQLYIILGAVIWRLLNKKIGLWYAHGTVTPSLRLATLLTHKVFTSTPEGFGINTTKRVIVGQGIDTRLFVARPREAKAHVELITVGRITESKHIETLLRACRLLKDDHIAFRFSIVGAALTTEEQRQQGILKEIITTLDLKSEVVWVGAIPNTELPRVLNQADVFIHDGATDSLDKALLEAALCGCIVVSSNKAYTALTKDLAPELLYPQGDFLALSAIIKIALESSSTMASVKADIATRYTTASLMDNIINAY